MSEKKATIQDAINARACYSGGQLKAIFGKRKSLTAKQIAKLGIPHKDKVWALTRDLFMDKKQCVIFAVFCAEQSLHLFETEHPNDDRPRKAIEAAKNWIKTKTAADAADAYAAADAADAAYAAAAAAAYATDAADAKKARAGFEKAQLKKLLQIIYAKADI